MSDSQQVLKLVNFKNCLTVIVILMSWFGFVISAHASEKQVIGWLEEVTINNHELHLKAKIDTGAATSSLNAKILKKFKRDNQEWVQIQIDNQAGQDIVLDKKVVRTVKIKRKLAFAIERPVILLGICLGKTYRILEVNLADRKNFEFRVLIGRNYLKDYFLVDSARTYTTEPSCK